MIILNIPTIHINLLIKNISPKKVGYVLKILWAQNFVNFSFIFFEFTLEKEK
jgi:hypothetical protein